MVSEGPSIEAIDVPFAGRTFRLSTAEGTDLVASKIKAGSYEAPLPMIFAAIVSRTSGLFLDVGANNGVYSLIASAVRPGIRSLAFEPFPPVIALLRENIELNGLQDEIDIVEVALSDEESMVPIYLPDQGHGLVETSASLQAGFIAGAEAAMMVQTRKLDDIDITDVISVIKVDIEGFELEFLRGADNTLRRDRPFVFAEMLGAVEHKFPEITRRLSDLDYLAFRLRTDAAILAHWITFDQSAWNYALVPREKLPLFRSVCIEHGLEILAPA